MLAHSLNATARAGSRSGACSPARRSIRLLPLWDCSSRPRSSAQRSMVSCSPSSASPGPSRRHRGQRRHPARTAGDPRRGTRAVHRYLRARERCRVDTRRLARGLRLPARVRRRRRAGAGRRGASRGRLAALINDICQQRTALSVATVRFERPSAALRRLDKPPADPV